MKVKLLFLFTSMLFINICFSQVTVDTLNKALNEFKTDRDAKFGVFKIVQYSGLSPNFRVIQDTEIERVVWDKKAALHRVMGKEPYLLKLVDMFVDSVPEQVSQLRAAISSEDLEEAKMIAHSIKGVAANLGGLVLQSRAAEMEQAAKDKDLDKLETSLPTIESELAELVLVLNNYQSLT